MNEALTYNSIIQELKDVPHNRLEELYEYVHSLASKPEKEQSKKDKILSYAGILKDMHDQDYDEFLEEITAVRNNLFDR